MFYLPPEGIERFPFPFTGTKFPFIMKLCFSSTRSMTIRNGDNNNANGSTDRRMDQDQ